MLTLLERRLHQSGEFMQLHVLQITTTYLYRPFPNIENSMKDFISRIFQFISVCTMLEVHLPCWLGGELVSSSASLPAQEKPSNQVSTQYHRKNIVKSIGSYAYIRTYICTIRLCETCYPSQTAVSHSLMVHTYLHMYHQAM